MMNRHPEVGLKIIRGIDLFKPAIPYIKAHHEWFDGTGYPRSLRGEEIPLEGRLLAVESPEQLFFHSDIPEKAGLLPPESARICRSLMDRGMDLRSNSAFARDPEALAEIIAGGLA